jgi:hypothetical protein
MPKIGDLEITGASGTTYTFEVYPLETTLGDHGAVFAITKRTGTSKSANHARIFIGETNRLRDLVKSHSSKPCFTALRANCICVHGENDKEDRIRIVVDLLAGDIWACNPRAQD